MALAITGLATIAACSTPNGGHRTSPPPPAPPGASVGASGPAGSTPSAEPPGTDNHAAPTGPAAPTDRIGAAATAFATAWARPGLPADRWWREIAPLCIQVFAEKLRTVDPANIPARAVTGPPTTVQPSTGGTAVLDVPTNNGVLRVTVTDVAGRWLVTAAAFTRSR